MNQRVDNKQRSRKAVVEDPRIADYEAEIERLRSEVARLGEENRAFVCSVRHMTNAAEEVLVEARREAAETRARAAAEAYERLVVARADARAAVHEERQRTAAEIELLAAVRERIQEERSTLSVFQDELSGRLRQLVSAVFDFEQHSPSLAAGPSWDAPAATNAAPPVVAEPQPDRAEPLSATSTFDDEFADVVEPRVSEPVASRADEVVVSNGGGSTSDRYVDTVVVEEADSALLTVDPSDEAEEELEAAFAAFFHADIEGEPSRHWILDGR